MSEKRKKALKGTVVVQSFKERLRLVWTWQRERYYHYTGLPDTKLNRTVAEGKARIIEGDMATGNFDPTLEKYKSSTTAQRREQVKVADLFEQFFKAKLPDLAKTTQSKYKATLVKIREFFKDSQVITVSKEKADEFRLWLAKTLKLEPATVKERLIHANACWEWAIQKKLVEGDNPWKEAVGKVTLSPKQKPKPFTVEEVKKIIDGFRNDRYYNHYADFVEFLFCTGCRIGEAIGLRWEHVSNDCSIIWIGESLTRGDRKGTKNNKATEIRLNRRLQTMLQARRPEKPLPDELVFKSPKGKAIDDHNFRNRAWVKVLEKVGVEYRFPRNGRHTFVSNTLIRGENPLMISEITRHDPEVMFDNYSAHMGLNEIPDYLDEEENDED